MTSFKRRQGERNCQEVVRLNINGNEKEKNKKRKIRSMKIGGATPKRVTHFH
jgi:hypothetical protein